MALGVLTGNKLISSPSKSAPKVEHIDMGKSRIDRNDCDRKNWSRVRIPKTWIHFFLANLANFYESLKRGAKDRNPLANNNFQVPETDYFTQQKQYLKRTTLRTYSAKAVP
jgi:hypothetical protein